MLLRAPLLLASSLVAIPCLLACSPTPDRSSVGPEDPQSTATPEGPTLDVEFLRETTRALAADELGGRLPGSEGGARATAQIIALMEKIGLEPAGEDGGWTQRVGMRGVTVDPADTKLALTKKGESEAVELSFGTDWVGTSFAAGTEQSIDAELIFMGYGVTAPEQQWDDYAGVDVSGKIVLVFVGDPPLDDGSFGGEAMTYYGRWTYKFERALAAGAAGCLVIHEKEPASYGWNVPQTSYTGERFHVLGSGGSVPAALPLQGWISREAAEALASRSGKSLARWHELAIDPAFRPIDLRTRASGQLSTGERRVEDVNVLGRLPGDAAADEAIVLSAHWDHLGTDEAKIAAGEDGIYNGAIDNASGVATMLGVAAELAGRARQEGSLDRSVLFLATTAEEQGLLGSRSFVANPTVPLDSLAAVVNLDSMNVYGETRAVEVVGWGQTTLEDRLVTLAEAQGRRVIPDTHPEAGAFYRSDHFPFALAGVPALYFHASFDMVEGGEEAGQRLREGVRERYHTPADQFDESWSFAGALQDAELVVALVSEIAAKEVQPRYKGGSEFADIRE